MKNITLYIPVLLLIFFYVLFAACFNKNSAELNDSTADTLATEKVKQVLETGSILYKEHCKSCHAGPNKTIEGISLFENLFERLPQPATDYFLRFVGDSDELQRSNDPYYNKIKNFSNNSFRHKFNQKLSVKELKAVMAYIMDNNNKQP